MSETDWMSDGLCKDMDPEVFFGVEGVSMTAPEVDHAKTICAQCPVREACKEYALQTNQEYGVWGMTSVAERNKIRRNRRLASSSLRQRTAERTAQARMLASQGWPSDQIARQLGVDRRTAQRLTAPERVAVSA